jgi:hypothetical protein
MRTQLLKGLTLLLAGAAGLCGSGAARAQYPAGYWQPGYARGYNPYASWGYGYSPYSYNPYAYQYTATAPGAAAGAKAAPGAADAYPQGSSGYAAQADGPGFFQPVLPMLPIGPDGAPTDDGHADKGHGHGKEGCPTKDCFWFTAGYDNGWFRPMHISTPLLTLGSPADLHPGALGQPGTVVLFGEQPDFRRADGVHLGVGASLDGGEHLFVELDARYFFPEHAKLTEASDAAGNPIITRPFFNVLTGEERAFFTSNPGVAAGSTDIDARSELLGVELNARYAARPSDNFRFDLLGGFRFLRLNESLTIRDSLQPLGSGVFQFEGNAVDVGDIITDVDSFKTVNHFYGLQLGGQATWEGKWLVVSAFGKAALGVTDQEVDINGASALFTPAGAFVAGGGVLALPSNIGQHTRTFLGFVPEGGVTVGVKVTPHLRLTAGYSFLWWNSVVRPGAQIDRVVNPALVPTDNSFGSLTGPARPAFTFHSEEYWIHTLSVGLDLHF